MAVRVPIRQVHSGLDGQDEIITINAATAGSIHASDDQFPASCSFERKCRARGRRAQLARMIGSFSILL
jgi:hypothetical protein